MRKIDPKEIAFWILVILAVIVFIVSFFKGK